MREVPLRELSNAAEVLREAERGTTLRITVNGRPVAELAPIRDRRPRFVARDVLDRLYELPVDQSWPDELRGLRDDDAEDPFERGDRPAGG